jgi:hypothetical protein
MSRNAGEITSQFLFAIITTERDGYYGFAEVASPAFVRK